MKRLTDLTDYKGILPSASEIFGVYQPLLGWKSKRRQQRIDHGVRDRLSEVVRRLSDSVQPQYTAHFAAANHALRIEGLHAGAFDAGTALGGVVVGQIAAELPAAGDYNPAVWAKLGSAQFLDGVLSERVVPAAVELYQQAASVPALSRESYHVTRAETQVRTMLDRESRTAGLLQQLVANGHFTVLEQLFYGDKDKRMVLWNALTQVEDPFATIDPAQDLDRVGLSPVGIAHLFREYFFELDTFLGPPVGHVWLAPGSTVELIEIQTRRVLVEQSYEQSLESTRKTELSTPQQDDLYKVVQVPGLE